MNDLTEHQAKVLGAIWAFFREKGKSPSYSELMDQLKIKSKQHLADFFLRLEEKGYIARDRGKKRGVNLTAKAISTLVDQGIAALGINFSSNFNYLSKIELQDSTQQIKSYNNDYTEITMNKDESGDNKQLSLFDDSNTSLKSSSNQATSSMGLDLIAKIQFLTKLFSNTVRVNDSSLSTNIVNAQNLNLNLYFESQKKNFKFMPQLNLNIKAKISKLMDLIKLI